MQPIITAQKKEKEEKSKRKTITLQRVKRKYTEELRYQ
jgi:hypothetical protein